MNRTATLVAGLRGLLIAANITTVVIGPLKDTPDIAVGLTPYPLDDDMQSGVVLQAVQILVRGSTTAGTAAVLDLQDDVFTVVGNLRDTTIGGIPVTVAWRQMSAPLSTDGHGRPEIRDTYYLRTDRLGYAG